MAWAWGISPKKIETIPLGDYNSDYYLTLMYHAMISRGWHVGYFDHDGIIAYTNISWPSYSEEVSARVKDNTVIVKSECVGYQGLFTDYGKNQQNLDLLFDEIIYVEQVHLKHNLEESTQELIDSIPEKQFLSLEDPPMAGKEQLRWFFSPIIPQKKYFVTPILVIINIAVYITTFIAFNLLLAYSSGHPFHLGPGETIYDKLYLLFGYDHRTEVLNGQVWRLVTSIFQHFSFAHLFFNMVALVYIGSLIECKLGRWNYLLMFLFTGIIASTASVAFHYTEISAGASGAIFGLFGILLALLSTDFYDRSARKALLISTAIFVGFNIIPVGEGIDHAAHFGGIISGYAFGWMAYAGLTHKNLFVKKWGIGVAGSVIVIVFVSGSLVLLPHYQVRKYNALVEKMQNMTMDLDSYFYARDDNGHYVTLARKEKLDSIEQIALPEVEKLKRLGPQFNKLVLPSKQEKAARGQAKLVGLIGQVYPLLYLEIKEQNMEKYRAKVDSLTMLVNDILMNRETER
jgi:rhomboid protease GluP